MGTRQHQDAQPRRRGLEQVTKKQTSDTKIKGIQVRTSEDDPQYIVKTDEEKKASHKPDALDKQ